MQLVLEVLSNLPDAAHCTQREFVREAKLSMAVKLFAMKRLSTGMAASLIDFEKEDLAQDLANA